MMAVRYRRFDQARRTNWILAVVFLAILASAYFLLALRYQDQSSAPDRLPASDGVTDPDEADLAAGAPSLPPPIDPPEPPVQWGGLGQRVPFARWWSSLLTEGGSEILWSNPLAMLINSEGLIALDSPKRYGSQNWDSAAAFEPELFIDSGPSAQSTRVTSYGDFHVVAEVYDSERNRLELTLTQGSPFLEIESDPDLSIHFPGVTLVTASETVATLNGPDGEWLLVSSEPVHLEVQDDRVSVVAEADFRLVLAPFFGEFEQMVVLASRIVADPIVDTIETLSVAENGTVNQELEVRRANETESAFVLLPHQRERLDSGLEGETIVGEILSALGTSPVVEASSIRLDYGAAPVMWGFAGPGAADLDWPPAGEVPVPAGSYFGGKEALRLAQLAQLAFEGNETDRAEAYLDRLGELLADLVSPGGATSMAWDRGWGSVIVEPAEFGSSRWLNDHSLQYGYWVDAASVFYEHRPDALPGLRPAVDLLVADYGGTTPGGSENQTYGDLVSTWSAYEGHSWAAGTVPFSAGNNLESTSESSHAWWAAARWFVVTGRTDRSAPNLARFTIETSLASDRWLPQSVEGDERPWSGVVWSASVDSSTWFDESPEAALGIKLLPITPASLARYSSSAQRGAAVARWEWCDANGGCGDLWPNLLDTDSVVAGRPPLSGIGLDEASTPRQVVSWWRNTWESGLEPATDWSCGAGVAAFTTEDDSVVYLGSNPGPDDLEVVCESGSQRLVLTVLAGSDLSE